MRTLITFLLLIYLLPGKAQSVFIPRHGAYETTPAENGKMRL